MLQHKGQFAIDCRKYNLILGNTVKNKKNARGEIKEGMWSTFPLKTAKDEPGKTRLQF
jgi:hypothetical protein